MTEVDYVNGRMILKSEYKYLNICREIPTRKWDKINKVWIVPLLDYNIVIGKYSQHNVPITTTERLKAELLKIDKLKNISTKAYSEHTIKFADNLVLLPYQSVCVEFLNTAHGVALISESMGLGKTIEALAWIRLHPDLRPIIIVCPATVKINWEREATKWLENTEKTIIINSTDPLPNADIYIINYDILAKHEKTLQNINAKLIVFDESHRVKNRKSIRSKVSNALAQHIPHKLMLTGTPIQNHHADLWHQLNILQPHAWGTFYAFTERYCDPQKKTIYVRGGMQKEVRDITGASNLQELSDKLKTIMIRRTKEQVLPELPDKRYTTIPVTITNMDEYAHAEKDLYEYLKQTKGKDIAERSLYAEALCKIEVLKQITIRGKMESIVSWLNDFIETNEKLVIFATHKEPIKELYTAYEKISVKLTGECSMKDRQNAIDQFQTNPDIKFIICNIQAGGIGITLTESHQLLFLEQAWTPADMEQAESRIHRLTQKNCANIYTMLGENTIDMKIHHLLGQKAHVIKQIMEEKTNEKIKDESIQKELVEMVRENCERMQQENKQIEKE